MKSNVLYVKVVSRTETSPCVKSLCKLIVILQLSHLIAIIHQMFLFKYFALYISCCYYTGIQDSSIYIIWSLNYLFDWVLKIDVAMRQLKKCYNDYFILKFCIRLNLIMIKQCECRQLTNRSTTWKPIFQCLTPTLLSFLTSFVFCQSYIILLGGLNR